MVQVGPRHGQESHPAMVLSYEPSDRLESQAIVALVLSDALGPSKLSKKLKLAESAVTSSSISSSLQRHSQRRQGCLYPLPYPGRTEPCLQPLRDCGKTLFDMSNR